MSSVLEKIKSRGYWQVIIRPTQFSEKRLEDFSALYRVVERSQVRARGWYYPYADRSKTIERGLDWIGQQVDWDEFVEGWRFYQSGQFAHFFAIHEDWWDQSQLWRPPSDWKPGALLNVVSTLFQYTGICEFAARLGLAVGGEDPFHMSIIMRGLQGRTLWATDFPLSVMVRHYTATLPEFTYIVDVSRPELAAYPRDLAQKAAQELFERFGWDAPSDLLRQQQELLRR